MRRSAQVGLSVPTGRKGTLLSDHSLLRNLRGVPRNWPPNTEGRERARQEVNRSILVGGGFDSQGNGRGLSSVAAGRGVFRACAPGPPEFPAAPVVPRPPSPVAAPPRASGPAGNRSPAPEAPPGAGRSEGREGPSAASSPSTGALSPRVPTRRVSTAQ